MSNAVNTLIICGNPGCGKTSISKHTLKNYLHDFYFLDKDTFYVKISGEFMEYVHQNRYDRDSPLYKNIAEITNMKDYWMLLVKMQNSVRKHCFVPRMAQNFLHLKIS